MAGDCNLLSISMVEPNALPSMLWVKHTQDLLTMETHNINITPMMLFVPFHTDYKRYQFITMMTIQDAAQGNIL